MYSVEVIVARVSRNFSSEPFREHANNYLTITAFSSAYLEEQDIRSGTLRPDIKSTGNYLQALDYKTQAFKRCA
jgi:hypothetical protein